MKDSDFNQIGRKILGRNYLAVRMPDSRINGFLPVSPSPTRHIHELGRYKSFQGARKKTAHLIAFSPLAFDSVEVKGDP